MQPSGAALSLLLKVLLLYVELVSTKSSSSGISKPYFVDATLNPDGPWWLTADIVGGALCILVTVIFIVSALLYVYIDCDECECCLRCRRRNRKCRARCCGKSYEKDDETTTYPKYSSHQDGRISDTGLSRRAQEWEGENQYEAIVRRPNEAEQRRPNPEPVVKWYGGRCASEKPEDIADGGRRPNRANGLKKWYDSMDTIDDTDDNLEVESLLKNSVEAPQNGTGHVIWSPAGCVNVGPRLDRSKDLNKTRYGGRDDKDQIVWTTRDHVHGPGPPGHGQMVLTKNESGQMIWTQYKYLRANEKHHTRQRDGATEGDRNWYDGIQGENALESTL